MFFFESSTHKGYYLNMQWYDLATTQIASYLVFPLRYLYKHLIISIVVGFTIYGFVLRRMWKAYKNSASVMQQEKPLEITRDTILHPSNVNELIIELDDRIVKRCNYGEQLNLLTKPQRMFYLNQTLEKEVNNGGFSQYFLNTEGKYAKETLEALKLIGAHHTEKLLQQAMERVSKKQSTQENVKEQGFVYDLERNTSDAFEDIDNAFFEYKDDLRALNYAYVNTHIEDFLSV